MTITMYHKTHLTLTSLSSIVVKIYCVMSKKVCICGRDGSSKGPVIITIYKSNGHRSSGQTGVDGNVCIGGTEYTDPTYGAGSRGPNGTPSETQTLGKKKSSRSCYGAGSKKLSGAPSKTQDIGKQKSSRSCYGTGKSKSKSKTEIPNGKESKKSSGTYCKPSKSKSKSKSKVTIAPEYIEPNSSAPSSRATSGIQINDTSKNKKPYWGKSKSKSKSNMKVASSQVLPNNASSDSQVNTTEKPRSRSGSKSQTSTTAGSSGTDLERGRSDRRKEKKENKKERRRSRKESQSSASQPSSSNVSLGSLSSSATQVFNMKLEKSTGTSLPFLGEYLFLPGEQKSVYDPYCKKGRDFSASYPDDRLLPYTVIPTPYPGLMKARSISNPDISMNFDETMLPLLKPRYHGNGCAMEVCILEKHFPTCSYRKHNNKYRHPLDDRCGSYEVIGRVGFQTCNECSELTDKEKITEVYSFLSETISQRSAILPNIKPDTNNEELFQNLQRSFENRSTTENICKSSKLVLNLDKKKGEQLRDLQKYIEQKKAIENLANSSKSFTDPLQRYSNLSDINEKAIAEVHLGVPTSEKSIQMTPKESSTGRMRRRRKSHRRRRRLKNWFSNLITCVDSDESSSREPDEYYQVRRKPSNDRNLLVI